MSDWSKVLAEDTQGNPVDLNGVPVASFPSEQGAPGSVLTNDGEGNWSWAAPTGGGSISGSGTSGKITKWTGASSIGDATNTDTDVASAVSVKHTQGTDTALGTLGTKNPPIDADLVIQRDSASAFALVTSTWTQVKAFLKTYFDTLYAAVGSAISGSGTNGKMTKWTGPSTLGDATNTDTDVASAVSLKHTQGTDTALGTLSTKNPPIDADKVIYRDSTAADALVTSTWTQVKAFLKTYFDTIYSTVAGAADAVTNQPSNGNIAISGLAADPDVNGAAGAGTAREFDSVTDPFTWTPSNPATFNANTTIKSHYYIKGTDNTERFGLVAWSPAGAFDARMKITTGQGQAGSGAAGCGLIITDSGNTNRVYMDGEWPGSFTWKQAAFTFTGGSYTQRGSTANINVNSWYQRITRDGSNNVSFWFSQDGVLWTIIAVQAFTFTVAKIGIRIAGSGISGGYYELAVDWLRTDV